MFIRPQLLQLGLGPKNALVSLFVIFKIFYVHECLLSYMCVYCMYDLWRPEEGVKSPETRITDVVSHIWEPKTRVLYKTSKMSPFSSPHLVSFNLIDLTSFSACMVIPTYLYAPSPTISSVAHNYSSAFPLLSSFLAFSSQPWLPLTSL